MKVSIGSDSELDLDQVELVFGGNSTSAGETLGGVVGGWYWGARNYMSETVFPYYLD